ncbi:MAG: glycosyltransferase family 4 protein [Pseudomonadota bacterium]
MKILVVHNAYQQRGGEDVAVAAEIALLRARGHEVAFYQRDNSELRNGMSILPAAAAVASTFWSRRTVRDIGRACETFMPDVIHAHNIFPLISPSLYWAAARRCVPVVQTLHNFRLLCPQAMFLREGKVCEDCLGKTPWRAITRKCYRTSVPQSALLAGMLSSHRAAGTYRSKVTRYIVPTRFCKEKFIRGGLPAERLCIKPNFVVSSSVPDWQSRSGGIFAARLSGEKGLDVLIEAMGISNGASIRIVGDGPLRERAQDFFRGDYLGPKSSAQVMQLLAGAQYLVAPSRCYETFGLVVIEAFACGTPVIASRHGGLGELVEDGVTGLLVNPADPADLALKINWAQAHPAQMLAMGRAARAVYEARYTPESNYRMLIDIYEEAIAAARRMSCSTQGTRGAGRQN